MFYFVSAFYYDLLSVIQASHGRTTIIIAHRLSTIQGADVIAAILDGKIAETGNHQTLLAKRGIYFDLVSAQVMCSIKLVLADFSILFIVVLR